MRFAAPLFIMMLAAASSPTQALPAPCSAGDAADYGTPGDVPKVSILHEKDLIQWQPPRCAGWAPASRAKLVVTVTGTFRFDGTMDELLARAGEISKLHAIPYWSPADKKWMPLARDAMALDGPNAKDRREDFSLAELKAGAQLYYSEDDSLTGEAVYGLKVYESSADRVVLGTDNITAIRKIVFTLFKPGASRSALFLQRISPGVFGARILSTAMAGTSSLVDGHEDVYVNRARAIYGFLSASKPSQARLALSSDQ